MKFDKGDRYLLLPKSAFGRMRLKPNRLNLPVAIEMVETRRGRHSWHGPYRNRVSRCSVF
ncbi:hypothetical protein [Microcoleus sp. N3A4]|uniref:hypothetical protein n=1 Tax=Microcoleus sp. N3A4 TaxID=3055379 RepID=UPI002FCECCF6